MAKKLISLFISAVLLISALCCGPVTVSAAALEELSFNSANNVFETYTCADGKSVCVINNSTVYRVAAETGEMTALHTFDEPETYAKTVSGTLYGVDVGPRAYVDKSRGLLYFARQKYKFSNAADNAAVTVYVYDLEAAKLLNTFTVNGVQLNSVGAADDGKILVATRACTAIGTENGVVTLDGSGNEVGRLAGTAETPFKAIDSFIGCRSDGVFYCVLSDVVDSGYGFDMTRGVIGVGTLKSNGFSMQNTGIEVKNITFSNYYRPAEMLDDHRVIASTGQIVDFSAFTYVRVSRSFTQDGKYEFLNHAGANAFLRDGDLYALTGDSIVSIIDLSTLEQTRIYLSDTPIFALAPCSDGVFLIRRDGDGFSSEFIGFDSFTEITETVYDLNETEAYKRSREDIVKAYSEAVPQDYDAALYAENGSASAPYKEYTITDETKDNALRFTNYIRGLGGLTGFKAANGEVWDRAAKGALLSQVNVTLTHKLSHYPEKPEDMDEDFYNEGYAATTSSNLASAYFSNQTAVLTAVRMFMDDRNHPMPGHRNTIMTRNGTTFAIGYAPAGAAQTIGYTGDPNPSGTALYNNDAAYTWPAPGWFPAEELATYAYWTITLNTDRVKLQGNALKITITDLDTGEEFVREATDVLYTTSWGTTLSFAPPTAESYEGKRYKVRASGLRDGINLPASIEYTVSFFSYAGDWVIDGKECTCDSMGRLTYPVSDDILIGDANLDGQIDVTDATYIQMFSAGLRGLSKEQLYAADVNADGNVDVTDATQIQKYCAGLISEFPRKKTINN